MVFSDLFFLFGFLPAFLLCYLAAGRARGLWARNVVLICFSLIFYAWGEPVYVFLMLASSVINYLMGLLIGGRAPLVRSPYSGSGRTPETRRRKTALAVGIALNLLILATFKYLGFLVGIAVGLGAPLEVPSIALPIGISFYTFQSISYLVDVYRREAPVQRNFFGLLLYISMFPQLIAGPIVRYDTVAREIGRRSVSASDIAEGLFRFIIGLGKKVILANQLSEVSDQLLGGSLASLSTLGAWVGIVAFTLQIYFDFSGYSDMAIGLGRCLGFHFNENFRHPYCCNSITDFWRRWHISLGSFFRDYVYIPMGGNRRHQAINIMVVWFLTGMWHGASWNFIIWGLYFGIIVMAEKYTLLKVKARIPTPLLHIYSLALVVLGWGIFYFDDFGRMTIFFQALFGGSPMQDTFEATTALTAHFFLWPLAIVLAMPLRSWVGRAIGRAPHEEPLRGSLVGRPYVHLALRALLSVAILLLSVCLLVGATNNAFIYTRF